MCSLAGDRRLVGTQLVVGRTTGSWTRASGPACRAMLAGQWPPSAGGAGSRCVPWVRPGGVLLAGDPARWPRVDQVCVHWPAIAGWWARNWLLGAQPAGGRVRARRRAGRCWLVSGRHRRAALAIGAFRGCVRVGFGRRGIQPVGPALTRYVFTGQRSLAGGRTTGRWAHSWPLAAADGPAFCRVRYGRAGLVSPSGRSTRGWTGPGPRCRSPPLGHRVCVESRNAGRRRAAAQANCSPKGYM